MFIVFAHWYLTTGNPSFHSFFVFFCFNYNKACLESMILLPVSCNYVDFGQDHVLPFVLVISYKCNKATVMVHLSWKCNKRCLRKITFESFRYAGKNIAMNNAIMVCKVHNRQYWSRGMWLGMRKHRHGWVNCSLEFLVATIPGVSFWLKCFYPAVVPITAAAFCPETQWD